MKQEHDIASQVLAAQQDSTAADGLVRQYQPFIRAETARWLHRIPQEGQEDELSIAMLAFYEAILAYQAGRGAFLPFAARVIRHRLIDFSRSQQRHGGTLSLQHEDAAGQTLLEKLDDGHDVMAERTERSAAREEIEAFTQELAAYGLALTDIADNCPRQQRTLAACHKALAHARACPSLLTTLTQTRKLPLAPLAAGAGVERKTLERHRRYMVALLLAYTNGFEVIRGHLRQVSPGKGGDVG